MIWLTWRQFRTQAIVTSALVAVLGIVLLASGSHLGMLARDSGFAACHSNCSSDASNFMAAVNSAVGYHVIYLLGALVLIVLPVVIGLFWGAPLIARELDSGTFRLAWNQSITRERWLGFKLGVLALTAMALTGLLSLFLGWWASPIDRAAALNSQGGFESRFFPALFGARGVVPIGYAAFAFAVGVLAGLLIRRVVPAMAVTLGVMAAVLIAMPLGIRPHLISPVHQTTALTAASIQGLDASPVPGGGMGRIDNVFAAPPNLPGAWVYSTQTVSASGSTNLGSVPSACQPGNVGNGPNSCFSALAAKHLKEVATYQPADRYWTFQWLELGIFLTAAILLTWACFWLIRRKLS